MKVTIEIPDDIAFRLREAGIDLARNALEAFALEQFRGGTISKGELRVVLGYGTRWQLDGFLKAHGVYEEITIEDVDRDVADLRSIFAKDH